MTALLLLLKSKAGRYGAALIMAALLCAGIYHHAKSVGAAEGLNKGHAEQLDADKKTFEQDRTAYLATLSQMTASAQQAQAAAQAAQARADQMTAALVNLAAQAAQADQAVNRIPDSGLLPDIAAKLNVRPPTDTAPSFYPAELRALDNCVTDQPFLQKQNADLGGKIDALGSEITNLKSQITNIQAEAQAAIDYGNRVTSYYVTAYNAVPRHRNLLKTIFSFGLRGKPPKLVLPDPATLSALKGTKG